MKDKKTKIINASDFLINEFLEGRSSKFDDKLAFILSRKATKGENCYGYENLAFCYLNGIGVKENIGKALKYFIKAAEGGNERAYYGVANILNDCQGKYYRPKIANSFFEKAAKSNNDLAMVDLGINLMFGRGCIKNEEKARYWLLEAYKMGNMFAAYELGMHFMFDKDDKEKAINWLTVAAEGGIERAAELLDSICNRQ